MNYWKISTSVLNRLFDSQVNQEFDYQAQFCAIHSNQIFSPEHTLFFGFKGQRTHGNTFAQALYTSGVRMFILQADCPQELPSDAAVWYVDDTTQAIQHLAKQKRSKLSGNIVGITGSYGKTVVKQWLADLAREQCQLYVSPGSYNSQIGVSLSILQAPLDLDLYIFEAGISQPNEMESLQQLIQPNIGVLTTVG